ncbi:hypothetical protein ACFQ36_06425 [Arthrobacter sp. GCM10027362]|uniref:hypothetical protein n=1 Tax=Arthrobacter sp. GCM10027362 TaxID=3273379 RepID=UPI0036382FB5
MPHERPSRLVVQTSPVVLPRDSKTFREPPRPVEKRQAGYEDQFDSHTLLYDVFRSDRRIVLSGPPLLNLLEDFQNSVVTDSAGKPVRAVFRDIDRTQQSSVWATENTEYLNFNTASLNFSTAVGQDLSALFAGKQALLTKSKNNNLVWIRDWVNFHVSEQGVDAVVIYDNGSTDYAPEDVLESLNGIPGLDVAVVVNWPFPFGPQGGNWAGLKGAPWDSDFCEYGILEHARFRFLRQARGVIQADVDELVITDGVKTVFELLDEAGSSALLYAGRWIETAGGPAAGVPRFSDYLYYDSRRSATTVKWTASPARSGTAEQWKTHVITGTTTTKTELVTHRHFMGISSNWKTKRTGSKPVDPQFHVLDEVLRGALARAAGRMTESGTEEPALAAVGRVPAKPVLEVIRESVGASLETFGSPDRVWFYRPTCLVLDYSWEGEPIAVDLVTVASGIRVVLHGRTAAAKAVVDALMDGSGITAEGGRFALGVLALDRSDEEIVDELSAMVGKALGLGAEPAAKSSGLAGAAVPGADDSDQSATRSPRRLAGLLRRWF